MNAILPNKDIKRIRLKAGEHLAMNERKMLQAVSEVRFFAENLNLYCVSYCYSFEVFRYSLLLSRRILHFDPIRIITGVHMLYDITYIKMRLQNLKVF